MWRRLTFWLRREFLKKLLAIQYLACLWFRVCYAVTMRVCLEDRVCLLWICTLLSGTCRGVRRHNEYIVFRFALLSTVAPGWREYEGERECYYCVCKPLPRNTGPQLVKLCPTISLAADCSSGFRPLMVDGCIVPKQRNARDGSLAQSFILITPPSACGGTYIFLADNELAASNMKLWLSRVTVK